MHTFNDTHTSETTFERDNSPFTVKASSTIQGKTTTKYNSKNSGSSTTPIQVANPKLKQFTSTDNNPILCIPRVFSSITEERVRSIFDDLNFGIIERIDMPVVRDNKTNSIKYQRVFIRFKHWYDNETAQDTKRQLLDGQVVHIEYDDPWYWKCFMSNKPMPYKAENMDATNNTILKSSRNSQNSSRSDSPMNLKGNYSPRTTGTTRKYNISGTSYVSAIKTDKFSQDKNKNIRDNTNNSNEDFISRITEVCQANVENTKVKSVETIGNWRESPPKRGTSAFNTTSNKSADKITKHESQNLVF